MVKKFSVMCDFGGQQSPFSMCVGEPEAEHDPIHFQADWLSKQRGGNVSPVFAECLAQIKVIAEKYKVPLDELCVYTLGTAVTDDQEEDGHDEHNDEEHSEDLEEDFEFTDDAEAQEQ